MICLLAQLVYWVTMAYVWVVIAAAVVSWLNPDPTHPVVRLIYRLTDPAFTRVRRLFPPRTRLDFSPIIVCFAVLLIQFVLVRILQLLGNC